MARGFHGILFCQMKHLIRTDHSHKSFGLVDYRNRRQVLLINQCFYPFQIQTGMNGMYIGCHDIFEHGFFRSKQQFIQGDDTHQRFMLIDHKHLCRLPYLLVCPSEKLYGFLGGEIHI